MNTTLGELERSVMDQLWRTDGAQSVREVHAAIGRDRDLAYTTVMTVLDRLAKKGLAVRERDGRAYRYAAAQSREALVAEVMHTALADDRAERTAALVAFVGRVSREDAAAMRAALARLEEAESQPEPGRKRSRTAGAR
ncbi:BlaI/MecI/CopY family transcriptional regulator [Microlunatus ginsengisoli]|uniref:Transcriptional repressor BlaI n=1 Tax=Microlunatus ginsengisoli TaxID=363863 RepID=A0ABP6ZKV7_9ACTN